MRSTRKPWHALSLALIAAVIFITLAAQTQAQEAQSAAETKPNVLLIASEPRQVSAGWLADYLSEAFNVEVTTIGPADYTPLIDAAVFDGFVYLGNQYFKPPSAGFLADIAATDKPVLWVNYHAWLLSQAFQEARGLAFSDVHSTDFSKINYFGMRPLSATDTSAVTAEFPALPLYWVYSDDLGSSLPGATVSGSFVYVSYLPALLPDRPDMTPFEAAADAALSQVAAQADPAPTAADRQRDARADTYRTSVHLPFIVNPDQVSAPPQYSSEAMHDNLLRIRDIGAETVIVHQTFFQNGTQGSEPLADPDATASFTALENIVEDAHKLGLSVRLSVIVNLSEEGRKPNDWRGFIQPSDPDRWWTNYRRIILEAATFARANDIEALTIGAELSSLEAEEERWRALIDAVRKEAGYENLIGYQINFDKVTQFTWGDAIDYLAVAAYWPLAAHRDEPLETLMASWDRIKTKLDVWLAQNPDVTLEFGEVGYTSQPYAAVFPFSWKPDRGRRLSLEEQENSYLSLEYMLRNSPQIAGVGIFASTQDDLSEANIGYSPFGKPAEDVVRRLMSLR
ncbi:hypothetical protein [Yoonia sp.]|uniref:glycoside hydrolase family 113 n=1 Tax=Yoonia sp. TaxID=2212373 RepID=UPI0035C85B52